MSARESLAITFVLGAITGSVAILVALELPEPANHMDITCAGMYGCGWPPAADVAGILLLVAILVLGINYAPRMIR
jgi:hypothetical protein